MIVELTGRNLMKPHWNDFALLAAWRRPDVLMASLFINLFGLILPIVVLQVYDRILPKAALETFSALILIVAFALTGEVLLRILRSRILSAFGARYEHRSKNAAMKSLLEADITEFNKETVSTYVNRLKSTNAIRSFYTGQAATLSIDLPFLAIYLILISMIGGILVLVPLVLLVLLVAAAYVIGEVLNENLETHIKTDKSRHNFLVETLKGVHSVKALGMERLMVRRYERLQERSAQEVVNLSQLNSLGVNVASTFSQLAMVSYVALGSFYVIDQTMTMGGLAAGTMLTGKVLQPVLRGLNFWIRMQSIGLSQAELKEVLSIKPESTTDSQDIQLSGNIELKNVWFRYRDDLPWILEDVSLVIPAKSTIGVTGENGCGFSTLLGLMNGTLKPVKGSVLLDGNPIDSLPLQKVRQQIGYLPESDEAFQGTILENVTSFRKGDHLHKAIEILKLLQIDGYIQKLPRGLETQLGESTVNALPAGVTQQFVIARALVDDPPIILFDNAHSGLDIKGDNCLRLALEKIKDDRTIVLGTFRPSFLKLCDRVYVLDSGKLIERLQDEMTSAPRQASTFQQLKDLSEEVNKRSSAARSNESKDDEGGSFTEDPTDNRKTGTTQG